METVNDEALEWGDHCWLERRPRRFELESGESVFQRRCARCARDFVVRALSGSRCAVAVSILSFHRLEDEVTQRWLSEACPAKRLPSDDEDRTKIVEEFRIAKEIWRE